MDLSKNFFQTELKKNIQALRDNSGISLKQLADILQIKYSRIKEYEFADNIPPLELLVKISAYFEVSLDYLIMGNKTNYPRNLKLLTLSQKFDQLDKAKMLQISSMAQTLLKDKSFQNQQDLAELSLTVDIHKNINIIRTKNSITQKQIAEYLDVKQNQISCYEKNSIPPIDKLFKLSEYFGISIHAIATGNRLIFNFSNSEFGDVMLQADHHLSFEEHKMLIHLMETILKK